MKKIIYFILLGGFFGNQLATANSYLIRQSEWPYVSTAPFLMDSPNALICSTHSAIASGIIIWSIGDTIVIADTETNSIIHTFRINTLTCVKDMVYDGSEEGKEMLYVAAGLGDNDRNGGLQIIDLSDLSSPKTLAVFNRAPANNPGYLAYNPNTLASEVTPIYEIDASGVGYFDQVIFLADYYFGMRVIDVSNPEVPFEIPLASKDENRISGYIQPDYNGTYDTTGGYVHATVTSENKNVYALMVDYYYGLRVFDVTDPTVISSPVSKNMRSNLMYSGIALVNDLFVDIDTDDHIYAYVTASDSNGIYTVVSKLDILSENQTLEEDSILNLGYYQTPGSAASGVYKSDNFVYVADGDNGLVTIDMSGEPDADLEYIDVSQGTYNTNIKGAVSLTIEKDSATLYLACAQNGLQVLDISDPTAPMFEDMIYSPVTGDAICVSDDILFMLDQDDGIRAFDNSTLYLKGVYPLAGDLNDIIVQNGQAYVSRGEDGIAIIDVSDPENMTLAGEINTTGNAFGMAVYNHALYVANGESGLFTVEFDGSAPTGATVTYETGSIAKDVAVSGNYAFVANGEGGLFILGLSGSGKGKSYSIDTSGDAGRISILETPAAQYAFVADGGAGLQIFDITTPLEGKRIKTVSSSDSVETLNVSDIAVDDTYAYVSLYENGILVLDISDPLNPVEVDTYASKSSAGRITISGDNIYVADRYAGFSIYLLYNTDNDTDPEPLEATVDKGCFVQILM